MQHDDAVYRNILHYMHGGVVTIDLLGVITNFNPAASRILGLDPEGVIGRSFAECFLEDSRNDAFSQSFLDAIYRGDSVHSRDISYYRAGKERHLSLTTSYIRDGATNDADKVGVIAVFADITERKLAEDRLRILNAELEDRVLERTRNLEEANKQLKDEIRQRQYMEDQLRHMSQHDALTGLPNRALFNERLELAIAKYHQDRSAGFTLLYFDLDGFKQVNDVLGHGVGDWLLQQVARRSESCLKDGDTVARMGGDEFTAILSGRPNKSEVEEVLQRLQSTLAKPYVNDEGVEAKVGSSIGVALCPLDGEDTETLVRCADEAMYRAKNAGKGQWKFYHLKD